VRDVRRYLREFLMDGYVIDVPYMLRWIIVHLFILPFRPKRSAEAYAKIWTDKGSPLLLNTKRFAEKVGKFSKSKVFWAMRYGNPSIQSVLKEIKAAGFEKARVVPLYPHHALSSTVTAIEEAKRHAAGMQLEFVPAFYHSKEHQVALAQQVKRAIAKEDHVLFSYHGLPVKHITKADPTKSHCLQRENCCHINSEAHNTCYRHQVIETTEVVAKALKLKPQNYSFSFQSRLGRAEWLKPMTSEFVVDLAQKGIRNLAVVAPAFVADNLETLEEVNIQLREIFLAAGGKRFTYIPCLNDDASWAKSFAALIDKGSTSLTHR
jgi:protoporphyrin/coproporphyrin ferrochelatase